MIDYIAAAIALLIIGWTVAALIPASRPAALAVGRWVLGVLAVLSGVLAALVLGRPRRRNEPPSKPPTTGPEARREVADAKHAATGAQIDEAAAREDLRRLYELGSGD